jgi:predicted metallo-beta-lactamase superfamily hydrolase
MKIRPVWFDSLGAKSMCVLVRTPDLSVLIDPGAAVMQPRYPAPDPLKLYYLNLANRAIGLAAQGATHLIITHYHYDHFRPELLPLYQGKTLWIKDPNRWINRSQWTRARGFLTAWAEAEGLTYKERPPDKGDYFDPVERLPLAAQTKRRDDLLRKWRKRFQRLVDLWKNGSWVDEEGLGDGVAFADSRTFQIGETTVRFSEPLFHGAESRIMPLGSWKSGRMS